MGILLERTVVKGPKFFSVQSVVISSLLIESGQCYITVIQLSSSALVLTMSDLPELPLFEEIKDISNSSDFFTYTQDEFNKTWSYYEDETMDSKTSGLWTTPTRNAVSPTFPTKTSPTRDTWDPMLWNINLTKYVELNLEDDVQIRKLPVLETPITPLPMEELNTVSSPVTSVLDQTKSHSQKKDQDQKVHQCLESYSGLQAREVSGESCLRRKVKKCQGERASTVKAKEFRK